MKSRRLRKNLRNKNPNFRKNLKNRKTSKNRKSSKNRKNKMFYGGETKIYKNGVYEGVLVNDRPNGIGQMTYKNGVVFNGTFDGIPVNGVINYGNGDFYDGDVTISPFGLMEEGEGIMTYANGNIYQGMWDDGTYEGEGIMTYANGEKYNGSWHENERHGRGTMTLANGDSYTCEWQNDEPSGRKRWRRGITKPESQLNKMTYSEAL